jgi:hypothetical protein
MRAGCGSRSIPAVNTGEKLPLEAGRTAIMRVLHTNQRKGRTWSETFGLRQGYDEGNDWDWQDTPEENRLSPSSPSMTAL